MKKPGYVTIEPTTDCNARCPQCPRTFDTTLKTDPRLVMDEWTPEQMANFLDSDWCSEIHAAHINGNYGDIVMHSQPKELIQVLIDRGINLLISTNGAALHKDFWTWLGSQPGIEVEFAIEGIDQKSHEMYRRKTRLDVLLKNAKSYIDAGGHAVWMMTLFRHNYTQVDAAKKMAEEYGFAEFQQRNSERFIFQDLIVSDGGYRLYPAPGVPIGINEPDSLDNWYHNRPTPSDDMNEWNEMIVDRDATVRCHAIKDTDHLHNIYVSADKKLWPCCFIPNAIDESYKIGDRNDWIMKFYVERGYDKDFNSLLHHTPEEILKTGIVEEIIKWELDICYQNCAGCA